MPFQFDFELIDPQLKLVQFCGTSRGLRNFAHAEMVDRTVPVCNRLPAAAVGASAVHAELRRSRAHSWPGTLNAGGGWTYLPTRLGSRGRVCWLMEAADAEL